MVTDMVACLTLTTAPNGSEQSHVGRVITTCLKHAGREILQCCLLKLEIHRQQTIESTVQLHVAPLSVVIY